MTRDIILHDVRDKTRLESFFRQHTALHIYSIGDLDDFFRTFTTWYALEQDHHLTAVILIYQGSSLPTVLAIGKETKPLSLLTNRIADDLPHRFYAHVSPGAEQAFQTSFRLIYHGVHLKMILSDTDIVTSVDTHCTEPLSAGHTDKLMELYRSAYPGHWFDPRMLDTGQYYGIIEDGRFVSAAGIHVYSPEYRVAALGNIVTHPDYRRKGFGLKTTARVCQSLIPTTDHIGLNVKADNLSAVSCYKKLGFNIIGKYGEFRAERV